MPDMKPCPDDMRWVNVCLTVGDIAAAVDFYQQAFGFSERLRLKDDAGTAIHAEVVHKDCVIMLSGEDPERKALSPAKHGGTSATIYVYTENVDAMAERAKKAGAKIVDPPTDQFWGDRTCVMLDPDGHCWMFGTHVADVDLSA